MSEFFSLLHLFVVMTMLVACGIGLGRLSVPRQRRDSKGHFLPTRIRARAKKAVPEMFKSTNL